MHSNQEFYRIQKLPPYVFAVINEMKAKARAAQQDVIDLGMGNPDGATPRIIVNKMIEAAQLTRALLDELGLASFCKTSGGKGLHVVVPLTPRLDYNSVKSFSQAFVRHLAKTIPERFSATSGPANRIGKVYVDYLRNGKAQTTATAFSARARPGMGVSMPISWEQLSDLKSGAQWTVQTAREYLSFQTQDPWEEYWSTGQSLASAIKRLR